MNIFKRAKVAAMLVSAIWFSALPLHAEDIEIYLQGGADVAGSNVLIVLETAGQVNTNFKDSVCPGGKMSTEMFCAMNMVVDNLSGNIRVGIGAQNRGGTDGGHIGFAISALEETVGPSVMAFLNREAADAMQERADSSAPWMPVNVDPEDKASWVLKLPPSRPSGTPFDATRQVGLVFDGVAVPSWATITSATIELNMRNSSWDGSGGTVQMTHLETKAPEVPLFDVEDVVSRDWGALTSASVTISNGTMKIDVSKPLQEAVSQDYWCGRNELALMIERSSFDEVNVPEFFSRRAVDADGVSLGGAILRVQWDPTKPSTTAGKLSCMGGVVLNLAENVDDASQDLNNNSVATGATQLLAGYNANPNRITGLNNNRNYTSGLRFRDVAYPAGTQVGYANLVVRVDEAGTSPLIVKPMLGNTPVFGAAGSITSRPNGLASGWVEHVPTVGTNSIPITALVQDIFASTGWTAGGALGIRLDAKTLSSTAQRIKLQAREGGSAPAFISMGVLAPKPGDHAQSINRRDELRAALTVMQSGAGGGNTKTSAALVEASRYLLELSPQFGDQTYADAAAFTDASRKQYVGTSSFAAECGGDTHIILVSNKDPNGGDLAAGRSGFQALSGDDCTAGWGCAQATAGFMRQQGYITHAVNFADNNSLETAMQGVASAGGGLYRYATNAMELAEAIAEIMDSIIISDASMAAPGVAVNQLNRFQHLDELYYALFKPDLSSYWEGNVKRFRLDFSASPPVIVDSKGVPAVDRTTGFFLEDSFSWWNASTEPDGGLVDAGGSREQLALRDATKPRRLLVSQSGTSTLKLIEKVSDLTPAELGINPADYSVAQLAIEMDARFELLMEGWGDPLHSEPRLVNYGFTGDVATAALDASLQDNTVYSSTNGGMLHAIDPMTGEELFAFMPREELLKTDLRYDNPELDADNPKRPTYGLDGGTTVWRRAGADGKPEHVYLYLAQRRGGRQYYALDATNRKNPSLLWQINGGSGDFALLGQTWSQPTFAQILINGVRTPVLVFGGGYSPADHDDKAPFKAAGDTMGRAIFIVDARTGALIRRFDSTDNADLKWAVPGSIAVVDISFDGVANYLYAADLAGQVFRVDLNSAADPDTGVVDSITGSKVVTLAKLGATAEAGVANHRRMHASPSIALSRVGGENVLQVFVGTGYRAHPLSMETLDRLYAINDFDALNGTSSAAVTPSDLADATDLSTYDPTTDMVGKRGWMIRLGLGANEKGEKALASAVISDGVVYFTTYLPETAYADPCQRVIGTSRLYAMNLLDGTPAVDFNNDGTLDRFTDLILPGLPPSPQLLLGPDGQQVLLIGTAAEDIGTGAGLGLRKKRWFEVPTEVLATDILNKAYADQGGGTAGDQGGDPQDPNQPDPNQPDPNQGQ